MKTLKAIGTTVILALALSVPAYAGDVLTPGYTAPPPPESRVTGEISVPTETPSTGVDANTPGLTDIVLLLLAIF